MKERIARLYIGVIHQKNNENDFVDIGFISSDIDDAKERFLKFKTLALKNKLLNKKAENQMSFKYETSDGSQFFEAFYVERIVILKGDNT